MRNVLRNIGAPLTNWAVYLTDDSYKHRHNPYYQLRYMAVPAFWGDAEQYSTKENAEAAARLKEAEAAAARDAALAD